MQKLTFIERVKAILKGGDDAKLARFDSKLTKYLDNQIKIRRDDIERQKDRLVDANEALNDKILNVDAGSIGTTDTVEGYVATYVKQVSAKLHEVETVEESIKTLEGEIARFEKLKSIIYSESVEA